MTSMMRNVYRMKTQSYGVRTAMLMKRWMLKAAAQKLNAQKNYRSKYITKN